MRHRIGVRGVCPVYVEIKTNRSFTNKGGSSERFVGYIDYLALNS